jgi:hypothetical protein
MSHPIQATAIGKKPQMPHRDIQPPPQWPSYQGTAQLVGVSPSGRVTVYVDPTLGPQGMQNAQDLVNDADRVTADNDKIFGAMGGLVSVIIFALGGNTDGTGGADHNSCDFVNGAAIEVCASFGNSARVSALLEAEYSECAMGGNLCGENTGEALSRWCAAVVGNNALADFATAPQWAQDGMPDYVSQTDPTDQNADSTGCGMAFISWLMSQGHSLSQIAQTMVTLGDSGTLAQLYANLTSDSASNAFSNFIAAVQNLPNGVVNDDPFNGAAQPAQLAHLAPWTIELAGKIFAAILADLAAGKAPHQIVASVRATMVNAPAAKAPALARAVCSIGSHRLVPPGRALRGMVNGPLS